MRQISLPLLQSFLATGALWAQPRRSDAADAVAGLIGCGGCAVVLLAVLALNIALLVWVAKDAKSRSMDGAVIWMVVVMFTGLLGLVIYIFARPQGELAPCPHCGNKRMRASATCPHCGNA